ncbi:MAG: universal stress protein [Acidobacteriota bacterium]
MQNVRNILVAVDLGESSKDALVEARALADRFGATLHLLCVVQDPFSLPWAPTAPDQVLSTLVAQMQRDAKTYLDRLVPAGPQQQVKADLAVRVGTRPSSEILAYAKAMHIDMIVVGKGDRGSPEAAAEAGSVAEAVVRGATCPVLVVPAHTTGRRDAQG